MGAGLAEGELKVRVVSVPPGQAPLWVREKWVGLELPLVSGSSAQKSGLGAPTIPKLLKFLRALVRGRVSAGAGYIVRARQAVDILEGASPEAAAWWRENAARALSEDRYFLFHADCCQPVRSPASEPHTRDLVFWK